MRKGKRGVLSADYTDGEPTSPRLPPSLCELWTTSRRPSGGCLTANSAIFFGKKDKEESFNAKAQRGRSGICKGFAKRIFLPFRVFCVFRS